MVQNRNHDAYTKYVQVLGRLMTWYLSHICIVTTYIFLLLSVLMCWLPHRIPFWMFMLMSAVIFGLSSGVLTMLSLPFIISMGIAAYYVQQSSSGKLIHLIAGISLFILGITASMHVIVGFHNFKILNNVYFSTDAIPYNLYLNFDEVVVGIFIIGFSRNLINQFKDLLCVIRQSLPITLAIIIILMLPGLALNFVHFDPKFSSYFWVWAPVNLLFTCVAEEAFYRGFIQHSLSQLLSKIPFGHAVAILLTSIIFGFRHTGKFDAMMLLATIAGIAYGYAYAKSKRIESSIFVHFSFNLTHFLLFTYPALRHI